MLNVVSFLGTESKGLGSPREPESDKAQSHSKRRTGVTAHTFQQPSPGRGFG